MSLLLVVAIAGCQRSRAPDGASDVKLDWFLEPDPPEVGQATAIVKLTGKDGEPIQGATVKLEGNMSHPGMTPVLADAQETGPGSYKANLDLTMGGDWFFLVNATLADGRKLSRKIDVLGVKSK
jgi:hypothetical protein